MDQIKTTDRDFLIKLAEHFSFLKRLAISPGPLKCNGEKIGKWRAVAIECDAARKQILEHCK